MSRIVHIDNSVFFRKLMGRFLSEMGYEYESFGKGEEALNSVKFGGVSMVITSLELIDMSGEELVNHLAESYYLGSVIVVSSSAEDERAKRLEDLGVLGIVQKSGSWKEDLRRVLE